LALKGSEALSIASSIATLTGVSFTWVATKGGFENAGVDEIGFKSISAIIGMLLAIGVLYWLIQRFSVALKNAKPENRVYCWTFGLAIGLCFTTLPMVLIYALVTFVWSIHY
jgi:hypothetical protein